MTTAQNNFMRRFLEASIADDPSSYLDLLAPDFVAHVSGGLDREGFIQHTNFFNMAFNDKQVNILDIISEGEKVVARIIWQGTHAGNFMGLPPTGKRVEVEAYIVERLDNGKSVEHWSLFDQMSMMQQLGVIPQPRATS